MVTSFFSFAVCLFAAILSVNHVSCRNTQLLRGISVRMLVVGKTGVGKSTLINNIFGKKLAKVGDDLEPGTTKAEVIHSIINGTVVTICDTPGFRDGQDKDEEYLEEIFQSCGSPDVVLFCIRIDETRWSGDYKATVLGLNSAFGKDIWSNTVLVLTFADNVDFNANREMTWKNKFSEQLQKIGVSKNVVSSIPVVMSSSTVGPNTRNWLPKLFSFCLRVSRESGKDALLGILIKHIFTGHVEGGENDLKLYYCEMLEWMETFGVTLGWAGATFLPIWFAGPIVGPILVNISPVIGWITGKGLEELLKWKYCNFGI